MSSPKKLTNRQQQANATRQKIIDVSQELIGEKGYLNVTVDDIASACGIAKGTLYNYFAGKEDIFIFIERGHFREVRKTVDKMELTSVFDKLKYFVLTWFECVAGDNLNVSKDWHKLAVELKVPAKEKQTHLDEDIDNVSHYILEGIKNNELSPSIPITAVATDIVFSMYGASFYRCSSYTDFDLIKWGKDFVDYVLNSHLSLYALKK
ncbi:MAG: TetR/AcrR family transcriptional regulator [Eubacteriales bacterium]|nr:TetR/AcrR family transcriptional regulator [Eubacteriales bacterium]